MNKHVHKTKIGTHYHANRSGLPDLSFLSLVISKLSTWGKKKIQTRPLDKQELAKALTDSLLSITYLVGQIGSDRSSTDCTIGSWKATNMGGNQQKSLSYFAPTQMYTTRILVTSHEYKHLYMLKAIHTGVTTGLQVWILSTTVYSCKRNAFYQWLYK